MNKFLSGETVHKKVIGTKNVVNTYIEEHDENQKKMLQLGLNKYKYNNWREKEIKEREEIL